MKGKIEMEDIQKVLVIGAGTMGHGFAQVFAQNGLDVTLVDETEKLLSQARGWIKDNLTLMVELDELEGSRVDPILNRIQLKTDPEQAAEGADYVLEAVSENLELKKMLFKKMGEATPSETILATNTSSYDINEFCNVTKHPERVIGTHWFHPPPITPCVEIIPGDKTSPETIKRASAFMKRMGKFPTPCKSTPGFVANRIQMAMAAEAFAIVQEGLATPQEVDRIVKYSFGFRLSAYGPFEICDQAGVDVYRSIFHYLKDKLKRDQFSPPSLLDDLVSKGRIGLKSRKGFYDYDEGAAESLKRERDRRLYARRRIFLDEQKED
jgi:3-hydroxyacyl-CoA dehydrogenase